MWVDGLFAGRLRRKGLPTAIARAWSSSVPDEAIGPDVGRLTVSEPTDRRRILRHRRGQSGEASVLEAIDAALSSIDRLDDSP
jgi:hypothetical protein